MLYRQTAKHIGRTGFTLGALLTGDMRKVPVLFLSLLGDQRACALRADASAGSTSRHFPYQAH